MAEPLSSIQFEDIPIEEARRMGRGPRIDPQLYHSILKFFQVDNTGMRRITSSARYFKEGVGSRRPN
jgi:hypothetical protein